MRKAKRAKAVGPTRAASRPKPSAKRKGTKGTAKRTTRRRRPRSRLSRTDWIEGALRALAEGGLPALGVEALAERLGVTKGSFYWHFSDAEELLRGVVQRWEELAVDRVMTDLIELKRPCDVLRRIIEQTVTIEDPQRRLRYRVEVVGAALAEWHPIFRPAYIRISERRLSGLCMLYMATGIDPDEATRQGRLAYMTLLGVYPLLLTRIDFTEADKQALVADLCARLLPPPCDA